MRRKAFHSSPEERNNLMEHLAGILSKRGEIVFAYVFGSFSEGLPFHDIDVGIYLTAITEEQATQYSLDLGQILSSRLRIPVDVRLLNFAPISFLYHVIRGKRVFERDEKTSSQVVEQTIQKYLDLKPLIRRGIKEAFGG
jgi:predicted nucleotidyltransferase